MMLQRRLLLVGLAVSVSVPSVVHAREISFRERVKAQEAILRVQHAHQIGIATTFEQDISGSEIERQVRDSLR